MLADPLPFSLCLQVTPGSFNYSVAHRLLSTLENKRDNELPLFAKSRSTLCGSMPSSTSVGLLAGFRELVTDKQAAEEDCANKAASVAAASAHKLNWQVTQSAPAAATAPASPATMLKLAPMSSMLSPEQPPAAAVAAAAAVNTAGADSADGKLKAFSGPVAALTAAEPLTASERLVGGPLSDSDSTAGMIVSQTLDDSYCAGLSRTSSTGSIASSIISLASESSFGSVSEFEFSRVSSYGSSSSSPTLSRSHSLLAESATKGSASVKGSQPESSLVLSALPVPSSSPEGTSKGLAGLLGSGGSGRTANSSSEGSGRGGSTCGWVFSGVQLTEADLVQHREGFSHVELAFGASSSSAVIMWEVEGVMGPSVSERRAVYQLTHIQPQQ
jgi:hypothetical protein